MNEKTNNSQEGWQRELIPLFLQTLKEQPGLEVDSYFEESEREDRRVDLCVNLSCRGEPYELIAQIEAGEIHPRGALQAVRKLRECPSPKMLIAPSLSEASRELLRREGFGFWDLSGSLFLELPTALYSVDRPPLPQPRQGREPRNLFKGSTAQVVHTLLLEPTRSWKVTELANQAQVSAYTAQKSLEYLEERLWVLKTGRGPQTVRHLKKPDKILDAWASSYELDYEEVKLHQYARDVNTQRVQLANFLNPRDNNERPWALTLEHGAHAYAPFLTKLPSALTVIVSRASLLNQKAQEAGYREVSSGENLRLLVTKEKTPFLGREQVQGIWVASPIQLYLDLYSWPRRGKEQAEHLRKERIKF